MDRDSGPAADATRTWGRPPAYDLSETTALLSLGGFDPTCRRDASGIWRTALTADGPATVHVRAGDEIRAEAWGPGAAAAMARVPDWIGLDQPAWTLPPHPVTDRLLAGHRGLRDTDTADVFEALVTFVLQQLVTWQEAATLWRRLCQACGTPAPGPWGLRMAPTPARLREAGGDALRALGIGPRPARTLIDVAGHARALPRVLDLSTPDALVWLQRMRGVGPWTAAMVLGARLGRPDPVPLGDVHLPHDVAWALAGEPRGTDARMQALLAPFEGQAFRVLRLIWAARVEAPRRGPRYPVRTPGRSPA